MKKTLIFAALICLGSGFMLTSCSNSNPDNTDQGKMKQTFDKAGDSLDKAMDKTGQALDKAADKTKETAKDAAEKTGDAIQRTVDTVKEHIEKH